MCGIAGFWRIFCTGETARVLRAELPAVPWRGHSDTETLLAAVLEGLIGDSDSRQRMGQRGRERAEGEFSQQRVTAETLAVYRELLH